VVAAGEHEREGVHPERPRRTRSRGEEQPAGVVGAARIGCGTTEERRAALGEVRGEGGPFRKLPGSRTSLYERLDRPALRPLPGQPYEYATWKVARVNYSRVPLDTSRSIQKRVPPPGTFSAPTEPSCASMSALTMARPRPDVPVDRSRAASAW
jgi:hypothetical protein